MAAVLWSSRLRPWGLVVALLACWPAWPQTQAASTGADARGWLLRLQDAASNRNYQGTLVFSAGGVVSSSRVAHYCDGPQRFERIETLDGQARQTLRHNDVVQTLWPKSRLAVLEKRDAVAGFPALPQGDPHLLEAYEMRSIGWDRVAGHDAQVLLFKPRDGLRFAQRLWSERSSGLLLRSDTLGPQGEVLESTAFSDVTIGGKSNGGAVVSAMRKLDGYRVVRTVLDRTRLEAEGWGLARPVPGFQLIDCMKRPLDAAAGTATGVQVLQAVFSDGLTHVSVFIEPHDASRHRPMRTSQGATHTAMSRLGDWWITVVGDVPMDTVQQFAGALERRR